MEIAVEIQNCRNMDARLHTSRTVVEVSEHVLPDLRLSVLLHDPATIPRAALQHHRGTAAAAEGGVRGHDA